MQPTKPATAAQQRGQQSSFERDCRNLLINGVAGQPFSRDQAINRFRAAEREINTGLGLTGDEPDYYRRIWAFARVELGLSESDFWVLTASEFAALVKHKRPPVPTPDNEQIQGFPSGARENESQRTPKDRIDDYRKQHGLTYDKLAEQMASHFSRDVLFAIAGEKRKVRESSYIELAKVLGCKPLDLYCNPNVIRKSH